MSKAVRNRSRQVHLGETFTQWLGSVRAGGGISLIETV